MPDPRFVGRLLCLAALFFTQAQAATLDRITGSVRHAERIALPADATLTVELLDVTKADGRADRLARLAWPTRGRQTPLAFELPFHPDDIRPAQRYALRATIIDGGGQLLFATPQWVPVLTHSHGKTVSMVLQKAHDMPASASLENTYWRLTEVSGAPARAQPGEREAHLLLLDGRASGGSGCNKLMGGYTTSGRGKLALGPLASTRMACAPDVMAQEAALLGVYARASAYRIDGETLLLLDGETLLARFEARHFDR